MVLETLVLSCMLNAFLAFATLGLFRLCNRRKQELMSVFGDDDWNHLVLQNLRRTLLDLAEPRWTESGRFASVERLAPKVEEVDREQTIRTLLNQIASDCKSTFDDKLKLANIEQFVKSVYRLQPQFGLSDGAMADILSGAIERIKGSVLLAKKVEQVELVKIGDRVDEESMWPLNPGLRVKQPLGLILRTENGKILSRAKVHCR